MTRRDDTPPELAELRHSIDNIDAAVLHLLAERFKCTRKVGELKAQLDMRRRPGARGPADRAPALAGGDRRPRSGVRREVPELPGPRGDPPP